MAVFNFNAYSTKTKSILIRGILHPSLSRRGKYFLHLLPLVIKMFLCLNDHCNKVRKINH